MSIVAAIKKNGRIYMAADTQSSWGDRKENCLYPERFKVHKFENGLLLGHAGLVHNSQIVMAQKNIFTLPEKGELNKRYIVENIIPELRKCYRKNNMLTKEEGKPDRIEDDYILAYKDKMFTIDNVFDVMAFDHYVAAGSGTDMVVAGLADLDSSEVTDSSEIEARLTDILRIPARYTQSVSGPYCLIDTSSLEYKLVD